MESQASSRHSSPPRSPVRGLATAADVSHISASRTATSRAASKSGKSTAPGFQFASKQGKMDFRSLGRLDLNRIRTEVDVDALQSLLANVTFGVFDSQDVASQTDDSLCHLVRYMQCCLEYMMYVQVSQSQTITQLQHELSAEREALLQREAEVGSLRSQFRADRRATTALENATRRSGGPMIPSTTTALVASADGMASSALVFQCGACAKAFRSREFLVSHMGRRHPGVPLSLELGTIGGSVGRSAVDDTVTELRAQRDMLARELAERNSQLYEALATTKALTAAADTLGKSRPGLVEHSSSDVNVMAAFTAAIASLGNNNESSRISELKTELASIRALLLGTREPIRSTDDKALSELRQQLGEMEQTLSRELAATRANLTSRAGGLLDDEILETATTQRGGILPTAGISADDVANVASRIVLQHTDKLEQRLLMLQQALLSADHARSVTPSSRAAPTEEVPRLNAPLPRQPTPLQEAIASPTRAQIAATASTTTVPTSTPSAEPFALSYQWQRLPDHTINWTGSREPGYKTIGEVRGDHEALPAAYKSWFALLPAATSISITNPPRAKIPSQWELEIAVPRSAANNPVLVHAHLPTSITIKVGRTTTVRQLREQVAKVIGIPVGLVILSCSGQPHAVESVLDGMNSEELQLFTNRPSLSFVPPLGDDTIDSIMTSYVADKPSLRPENIARMEAAETSVWKSDDLLDTAKFAIAVQPQSDIKLTPDDIAVCRDDVEADLASRLRDPSLQGGRPRTDENRIQALLSARLDRTRGHAVVLAASPIAQKLQAASRDLRQSIADAQTAISNVGLADTGAVRPEKVHSLKRGILYATKFLLESSLRASKGASVPSAASNLINSSPTRSSAVPVAVSHVSLTTPTHRPVLPAEISRAAPPVSAVVGLNAESEEGTESIMDYADRYEAAATGATSGQSVPDASRPGVLALEDSIERISPEVQGLSTTLGNSQISDLTASQFLSPASHGDRDDSMQSGELKATGSEDLPIRVDESLGLSQSLAENLNSTSDSHTANRHLQSVDSLMLSPNNDVDIADSGFRSRTRARDRVVNLAGDLLSDDDEAVDEDTGEYSNPDFETSVPDVVQSHSDGDVPAFVSHAQNDAIKRSTPIVSVSSRPPSVAELPVTSDFDDIEEEVLSS